MLQDGRSRLRGSFSRLTSKYKLMKDKDVRASFNSDSNLSSGHR